MDMHHLPSLFFHRPSVRCTTLLHPGRASTCRTSLAHPWTWIFNSSSSDWCWVVEIAVLLLVILWISSCPPASVIHCLQHAPILQ
jgi:hypothetical protein